MTGLSKRERQADLVAYDGAGRFLDQLVVAIAEHRAQARCIDMLCPGDEFHHVLLGLTGAVTPADLEVALVLSKADFARYLGVLTVACERLAQRRAIDATVDLDGARQRANAVHATADPAALADISRAMSRDVWGLCNLIDHLTGELQEVTAARDRAVDQLAQDAIAHQRALNAQRYDLIAHPPRSRPVF
jgi:hypothetical protein